MRFAAPNCPTCDTPADGVAEVVQCVASLSCSADGEFSYTGDTSVDWNSQEVAFDEGRALLFCSSCGSNWLSKEAD